MSDTSVYFQKVIVTKDQNFEIVRLIECENVNNESGYKLIDKQSWALNTFLYLNTKYMLKMYLNTKYFLQMYLNTKYIDVFKYFLNTFVNTFLYYFQNSVLIHSIHYKFENERNIRHKISSAMSMI